MDGGDSRIRAVRENGDLADIQTCFTPGMGANLGGYTPSRSDVRTMTSNVPAMATASRSETKTIASDVLTPASKIWNDTSDLKNSNESVTTYLTTNTTVTTTTTVTAPVLVSNVVKREELLPFINRCVSPTYS